MSTVNIVPKEYEVCVWCIPRNSEQLQQVVELTVNITNNGYWGWHVVHVLDHTHRQYKTRECTIEFATNLTTSMICFVSRIFSIQVTLSVMNKNRKEEEIIIEAKKK
jgi:hypothetical protein